MPISGNTFSYTNPTGATSAAAGQVVQSAVWNQIHTDLANAVNQVYAQEVAGITFRNFMCDNGTFEIWQRTNGGSSASVSVAASTLAYTADRWYLQTGVNQAYTVSAVPGLAGAAFIAGKVQRTAGQTGITQIVFAYPFDQPEIVRMLGYKLNVSMLVSTGANWSPASGTFTVILYYGTGAPAKRNATPYAGEVQGFAISTNLAAGSGTTAIAGSTAVVIPANTTQMELQIAWTPVGTAGATDSITFDDVQLEAQNSALAWAPTAYDRIQQNIELIFCKRHYQKTMDYSVSPSTASPLNALSALAVATQRTVFYWEYPIEMRAVPAILTLNPMTVSSPNAELFSLGADSGTSVAVSVNSTLGSTKAITFYTTTSGGTTNQIMMLQAIADAGI